MTDDEVAAPAEAFVQTLEEGLGMGILAFVLTGYGVGMLLTIEGFEAPNHQFVDVVGWVSYNAHFVDVGYGARNNQAATNFLTGPGRGVGGGIAQTVPAAVYHLVPIAALVGVGAALVEQSQRRLDRAASAATGAAVVSGYLAAAVGGVYLLRVATSGNVLAPNMARAAFVAGICYPLVFGSLGGLLAHER